MRDNTKYIKIIKFRRAPFNSLQTRISLEDKRKRSNTFIDVSTFQRARTLVNNNSWRKEGFPIEPNFNSHLMGYAFQ